MFNLTVKNKICVVILFVICTAGLYFSFFYKNNQPEEGLDFSASPDTYLHNSELTTYQQDGKIKLKIHTPEGTLQQSADKTHFKHPTLLFQQQETLWNVKADTAKTDNHLNNIDLYGNVKAVATKQQASASTKNTLQQVFSWDTAVEPDAVIITAHEAHHHNKIHYSEFLGPVRIEHQVHHITCTKLIVKNTGENQEFIAYGTPKEPAVYRATPSGQLPLMAKAKYIYYYPKKNKVIFRGDVHVTQDNKFFSGEKIIYDIKNEVITVPPNSHSESTLILNPEQKSR